MFESIAVLGAGSWGTALAVHLARVGHDVRLWARDPDLVGGDGGDAREPALPVGRPAARSRHAGVALASGAAGRDASWCSRFLRTACAPSRGRCRHRFRRGRFSSARPRAWRRILSSACRKSWARKRTRASQWWCSRGRASPRKSRVDCRRPCCLPLAIRRRRRTCRTDFAGPRCGSMSATMWLASRLAAR